MSFLEFLTAKTERTHKIEGLGGHWYFFDAKGKHIGYTKDEYDYAMCDILSFQIAEGNWYSDLLDEIEAAFGEYDQSFDANGTTFYLWRAV